MSSALAARSFALRGLTDNLLAVSCLPGHIHQFHHSQAKISGTGRRVSAQSIRAWPNANNTPPQPSTASSAGGAMTTPRLWNSSDSKSSRKKKKQKLHDCCKNRRQKDGQRAGKMALRLTFDEAEDIRPPRVDRRCRTNCIKQKAPASRHRKDMPTRMR